MSKPLAVFVDPEKALVDYLTDQLAGRTEECADGASVGVTLPAGWGVDSDPYVLVACDGVDSSDWPVVGRATVRVTVWHSTSSNAKALAGLTMALLLAHPGGDGVAGVRPGSGVYATADPDSQADLASFTVRALVRSTVAPS